MTTLASSCARIVLRLKEYAPPPSEWVNGLHARLSAEAANAERVRIEDISNFMGFLEADAENPDIGLHCRELFHPGQLYSQLYPMMSSPTLGDALKVLAHSSSLLSDGLPLLILEEADSYSIVFLRLELLQLSRSYIDCYLSTIIAIVEWLLPARRVKPIAASFSYDQPVDGTALQDMFGPHLTFSDLVNKISFSPTDWHLPLPTRCADLRLHHEIMLNGELQNFPVKTSSVVKNHIVVGLAKGVVISLESTAGALNLTPRMLRSRLDDELTGFRELQDECRLQLARHLIRFTHQSPARIAQRLGFNEISSFYRACNRWFGCSPGAYRLRAERRSAV